MRRTACLLVLAACGTDVRSTQGTSDPGVDGGLDDGGAVATTVTDAGPPLPDGGGAGDGGGPVNLTPCEDAVNHADYTFIETTVFAVSCATGGCHKGSSPAAGLDLSPGRAYAGLVNVPSSGFSGWTRVVPYDSPGSMLMVQVGGETGPALEGLMPWGQPRLCDPLVDAMRRWIAAGAAHN